MGLFGIPDSSDSAHNAAARTNAERGLNQGNAPYSSGGAGCLVLLLGPAVFLSGLFVLARRLRRRS